MQKIVSLILLITTVCTCFSVFGVSSSSQTPPGDTTAVTSGKQEGIYETGAAPLNIKGTTDVWDGVSYETSQARDDKGYILLSSAAQVAAFLRNAEQGDSNNYRLTCSVDMGAKPLTGDRSFFGSLNGDGYSILNLQLTSDVGDAHLFSTLGGQGCVVRNLSVTYTATAPGGTASLFGWVAAGTKLDNLRVHTALSGLRAGGLGETLANSTFNNCVVTGTMETTGSDETVMGGLFLSSENGVLENSACYLTMTHSGENGVAGGIVGRASGSFWIQNCHNYATIRGSGILGAIVGEVKDMAGADSVITMMDCFHQGIVSEKSTETNTVVGGMVGRLSLTSHTADISFLNSGVYGTLTSHTGGAYGAVGEMQIPAAPGIRILFASYVAREGKSGLIGPLTITTVGDGPRFVMERIYTLGVLFPHVTSYGGRASLTTDDHVYATIGDPVPYVDIMGEVQARGKINPFLFLETLQIYERGMSDLRVSWYMDARTKFATPVTNIKISRARVGMSVVGNIRVYAQIENVLYLNQLPALKVGDTQNVSAVRTGEGTYQFMSHDISLSAVTDTLSYNIFVDGWGGYQYVHVSILKMLADIYNSTTRDVEKELIGAIVSYVQAADDATAIDTFNGYLQKDKPKLTPPDYTSLTYIPQAESFGLNPGCQVQLLVSDGFYLIVTKNGEMLDVHPTVWMLDIHAPIYLNAAGRTTTAALLNAYLTSPDTSREVKDVAASIYYLHLAIKKANNL